MPKNAIPITAQRGRDLVLPELRIQSQDGDPPGDIIIAAGQRELARIRPTGDVELGDDATTDEVAAEFWQLLGLTRPEPVCRRCSECEGEEHHWLPDAAELLVPCKHCDATREWDDEDDASCEDDEPADEPSNVVPWGPRPHKIVEVGQLYRRVDHTSRNYGEEVRVEAVDEDTLTVTIVVPGIRFGSREIGKVRDMKRGYFMTSEWWSMAADELDERDTKPFCALNSSHYEGTVLHRIRAPSGIALVLHDQEGHLAAIPSGGYHSMSWVKGDVPASGDDTELAREWLLGHSSHRCKECGRHTFEGLTRFAGYMRESGPGREAERIAKLRKRGICQSCEFWHEKLEVRDDPNAVRVKGNQYTILPDEREPGWGSGFGGAKFVICFHDGRRVVSRNLWDNGRIPRRFRERLADNATFEGRG